MKRCILPSVLALFVLTSTIARGIEPNVVFRAMKAEMDRSMRELRMGDLRRPYHIEYAVTIRRAVSAHALLGSLEDIDTTSVMTVDVRVRVGNEIFDNTNFFDVSLGFFGSTDDEEGFRNRRVPKGADERRLRRELWLATDACYKQALEIYSKKEATLKNKTRIDTTPDFQILPPTEQSDIRHRGVRGNIADVVNTIVPLSAIFRDYPEIYASRVGMEVVPVERFILTSEGRQVHTARVFCGIEVIAATQAENGQYIGQTYAAYGSIPSDLPNADSLRRAVTAMARMLAAQRSAPTIEAYSGPVVFEGQAAAEVVIQHFAPQLVAQRPPLSDAGFSAGESSMAFQNKIGARVLPEFLSVLSVPLREKDRGRPVVGGFRVDDEGTLARDITVVDKGYLRTLLSSRVPTKRIRESNGNMRGGAAMYSVLEVRTDDAKRALDGKALRARLLKLVKDRALPYGIIVRKALNTNLLYTGIYPMVGSDFPLPRGEGKLGLLEVVRVYPDGREEIVRGVEAAGLAPLVFKDIVATSTTTSVHNALVPSVAPPFITGGSQYHTASVITPDLLFEDIEIRPLEGDVPKLPLLSSPLMR